MDSEIKMLFKRDGNRLLFLIVFMFCFAILKDLPGQVRIKDVARIQGLEDTQLMGYGLVVGLNGTGDGPRTQFTIQTTMNMLRNMGIVVPDKRVRVKNIAAVMVTAKMVPFQRRGSKLDILVSSIGDARSLEGGTLLMTPLLGPNGNVYAVGQGALSVGGYSIESMRGPSRKKNHTLVGYVSDGAIVKKEILTNELNFNELVITLNHPDFTSALRMAEAIDNNFNEKIAEADDAASIIIQVPAEFQTNGKLVKFISGVEQLRFRPSTNARIIVNEKTGTIVAGGDVKIGQVAVSHGNINIAISSSTQVSQPPPLSPNAQTQIITDEEVEVVEEKTQMVVLEPNTSVNDLAQALNGLGVTPRDIIAIFQAIKKAGALQAELIIM